ncbi:hypothetical protein [Oecophyllibacter saccharovorans]|nr:hypothetical protein [Oecophyllibacter saccharovorans]
MTPPQEEPSRFRTERRKPLYVLFAAGMAAFSLLLLGLAVMELVRCWSLS